MTINTGPVAYHKNSLQQNDPAPASEEEGGYVHYQEKVEGRKIRQRSDSFKDHYSQAKLFWNSMSPVEKEHIISAFRFEVGKVKSKDVRRQVVEMFNRVDHKLAKQIAAGVGVKPLKRRRCKSNAQIPGIKPGEHDQDAVDKNGCDFGRHGSDDAEVSQVIKAFRKAGVIPDIISTALGMIKGDNGKEIEAAHTLQTADSVLYDAVYIPGGKESIERLKKQKAALDFINEAFSHYKAIGALSEGIDLLMSAAGAHSVSEPGVITAASGKAIDAFSKELIEAIGEHRQWERTV